VATWRSNSRAVWLFGVLGLTWALLTSCAVVAQTPHEGLTLHFFDVGQGDAVLISAPTGQRVLVDAGPGARVVEHLRALGVDTIDLFIASHNHADHIGGAVAVLRSFPVRLFMENGIPHTTVTYQRLLETLVELDIPVLDPERRTIRLGEATLDILPPSGDPALEHNDNSIGVIVQFGAFRASMAGDAEARLWEHWLEELPDALRPVAVHKASHHGSRHGDILPALRRLRPSLVVVSAGVDNSYGHPHPDALERYRAVGAEVLVTASEGTVVVVGQRSGGFSVHVSP